MDMSQDTHLDSNYNYSRAPTDRADPVVSFSSADNAWRTEIKAERDATFNVGYREDADLGAFLARPLKIYETRWQVGIPLNVEIDPWSLFMNNPNVLRRIENFFLFRGDLDIKVMINGNGFYYGRLLVNYHPLKNFRVFDVAPGNGIYNIQASQRPHIFIDPSTSTGGEMFLPYFYPKNWINLAYGEYNQLGRIGISTLNDLNQANSGTGAVTINIFASMKNVQMTMPTINPVGSISPQAGLEEIVMTETDEKKKMRILRSLWADNARRNQFSDNQLRLHFDDNLPVIREDVRPEAGEDSDSETDEESPPIFRSTREREDWLQDRAIKKARRLAEEEEPKSRICGDPVAIIAAAMAGLSAAGFGNEIRMLRERAKKLEKAVFEADQLTTDISKTMDLECLDDIPLSQQKRNLQVKPESGKGKGGKGGQGKGGKTTSGSTSGSDEYGEGIISKPASVLAKAAGAITNVPVIGKYAMASKFALDGIANVARIFGYSRPPVVDSIKPVKVQPAGYLAPTDADEVVAKLALDSKQELSIDPTTVGLEATDQMSLAHVLQKESYLTSFKWDEGSVSETVLFNMNLCPAYFDATGTWPSLNGRAGITPFSHIAQMFQNWRGSIVVRFQIVASQFHKGRIRITWDPYSTGLFSSADYNIAYNRVVDLAEDRDFEMTFRWGQAEAWKRVPAIRGINQTSVYNSAVLLPLAERTNGMLQVSVVNNLTTPNPAIAAPVEINVFVRAGDDFELANPTEVNIDTLSYMDPNNFPPARRLVSLDDDVRVLEDIKPESGEAPDCNEETDNGMSSVLDNAPVVVDQLNAAGGDRIQENDDSLTVFMGEKVASLRQLMKRYCWHDCFPLPSNTGLTHYKQFILNMPVQRGYSFEARTKDDFSDPFNFTHMTWMNYIIPAYAGWRGGIRRKAQLCTGLNGVNMAVARDSGSITANGQTFTNESYASGNINQIAARMAFNGENGRGGAYTTDGVVNGTLEYELPFYSEYRFAHTQSFNNANTLTRFPDGLHHAVEINYSGPEVSSEDNKGFWRTAVATGEDFSLFWYLNVPTMFTYDDTPPLP